MNPSFLRLPSHRCQFTQFESRVGCIVLSEFAGMPSRTPRHLLDQNEVNGAANVSRLLFSQDPTRPDEWQTRGTIAKSIVEDSGL